VPPDATAGDRKSELLNQSVTKNLFGLRSAGSKVTISPTVRGGFP